MTRFQQSQTGFKILQFQRVDLATIGPDQQRVLIHDLKRRDHASNLGGLKLQKEG